MILVNEGYGDIVMIPFSRILQYGNIVQHKKIKKVQTGRNHVAVLSGEGELYTRGLNNIGQLGVGDNVNRTSWQKVLTGVQDVWCGINFTLALMLDGRYLATGYGYCGGATSSTNTFVDRSTVFNSVTSSSPGTYIEDIKINANNTMVLRSDGTLWGVGSNNFGEITGSTSQANTFKQITTPTIAKKIYSGFYMFGYSDEQGRFYVTGEFIGYNSTAVSVNFRVMTRYNIGGSTALNCIDYVGGVTAGYFIVYSTLDFNYYIYAGGSQNLGELGDGVDSTANAAYKRVPGQPGVAIQKYSLFSGDMYYQQSFVTAAGIYVSGFNSGTTYGGKLGIGSTVNSLNLSKCIIPEGDFSTAKVCCTYTRTYVLMDDTLYSSGTETTFSTVTGSTSFVIDSPII